MAKLNCAICQRAKDEDTMKVFTTTAEERALMQKMGEKEPKESYAYCRSCLSILSNQVSAVSFMKGLAQVRARAEGIAPAVAEKAAERFAGRLLTKGRQ